MNKRTRTKNRLKKEMENIFLEDYDWMHYTLSSKMPTKAYGVITIEFEYDGFGRSTMKVKTEKKIYTFRFDSKLFHKHIIIFMQKHMQQWETEKAFFGIEEVVNFYNAVLAHPKTTEEKDDDRPLYSDGLWEYMRKKCQEE